MDEAYYIVRLKMHDGLREWTEEHTEYARTPEDAVACAAANAHHTHNVRGATVEKEKSS